MFDLFRSRDKLVKYVLSGVLVVVAASMITYLIPSYGNAGLANNSPVVAEIGGQKITALFAQQTFDRVTKGTQIPPEAMDIYLPQFMDSFLQQRIMVYQAQQMGLTVTDDDVLTGMKLNYPQFFPGGVLASQEQLEQYFQQQGQTLEDGIEDMRNQLTLRKLQDALLITTVVAPKEVEEAFTSKYAKAKVEYIAFPPAKFRDQAKFTPDQVRAEYDLSLIHI